MSSEGAAAEGRRSPRTVARIPLDLQPVQESCTGLTAVINLMEFDSLPCSCPSGTALKIQNSIRARVVWTGPADSSGSYKLA